MSKHGISSKDIRLRHLVWAGKAGLLLDLDHSKMRFYQAQGYARTEGKPVDGKIRWVVTDAGQLANKRQPSM